MNPDNNDSPSFHLEVLVPENEICDWLDSNVGEKITVFADMLSSWMKVDARAKLPAEQRDYRFCPADLAIERSRFKAENGLEHVKPKSSLLRRCNPFERIDNAGFRSRKAVKAANLDWLVQFSEPLDQNGKRLVEKDGEGLCYSDIYGYGDGFDEYIEWRKRTQNKRTTRLDLFSISMDRKSFRVTDPISLDKYIENVRKSAIGARLHLLAVDYYHEGIKPGSLKLSGSAEIMLKHSTLSYCLLALTQLRPNGSFIMKIYTTHELFTVGLLYLMYRCFHQISLVQPNSCRPDTPERYLICKWKKDDHQTEIMRQHLYKVYMELSRLKDTNSDVVQLIPFEILEADTIFFDYVYNRNEALLRKLIRCWECIKRYSEANGNVRHPRQCELKKRCIALWNIPTRSQQRRCRKRKY